MHRVILLLSIISYCTTLYSQDRKANDDAQRVWELAVQAQGGRDTIASIKNLLIDSELQLSHGGKMKTRELLVFPYKYWSVEFSPPPFGSTVEMYDYEHGTTYRVRGADKNAQISVIGKDRLADSLTDAGSVRWAGMVQNLIETPWWQPHPISYRSVRNGGNEFDVVLTSFNGGQVEFYFDKKTHFATRIVKLSNPSGDDESVIELKSFRSFSGLWLPTEIRLPPNTNFSRVSYQINVAYNSRIFETPITPAKDAWDAWKPKTSIE